MRLYFWMSLPAFMVLAIAFACLLRLAAQCKLSREALLEAALPNILRILFIFYPIVTNVAFEAFSCFEFDEGAQRFLATDESITCNTPAPFGDFGGTRSQEHDQVMLVAAVAVAIYPIGLIVLNCGTHRAASTPD